MTIFVRKSDKVHHKFNMDHMKKKKKKMMMMRDNIIQWAYNLYANVFVKKSAP